MFTHRKLPFSPSVPRSLATARRSFWTAGIRVLPLLAAAVLWTLHAQAQATATLTTLHSFTGSDGQQPQNALVQGSDGNFYGTTVTGGANNDGTVFQITSTGVLTTLHSFSGSDGENPFAALVQGSDSNFYGTTYGGGTNSDGTVFLITPTGALTTLYSLRAAARGQPPLPR